MSGVNLPGFRIRKAQWTPSPASWKSKAPRCPRKSPSRWKRSPVSAETPLVVAENSTALGVIHLKDIVKGGLKERLARLRAMGIRTIMITATIRSPPR